MVWNNGTSPILRAKYVEWELLGHCTPLRKDSDHCEMKNGVIVPANCLRVSGLQHREVEPGRVDPPSGSPKLRSPRSPRWLPFTASQGKENFRERIWTSAEAFPQIFSRELLGESYKEIAQDQGVRSIWSWHKEGESYLFPQVILHTSQDIG